ncbi:MAG: YybH family protein [Nitrospinota bacterium]
MKRLTSLLMLFLLLGMATWAWAGPREEVAQAIRQWIQAQREGNSEAMAALYADDAVFFSGHIPFRVDGKEAIRRHWAAFFKEFPTRRSTVNQLSRKIYGDSTAVSALYSVSTLVDRNGKVHTDNLRYTATRVKVGGKWLVVSTHVSHLPDVSH